MGCRVLGSLEVPRAVEDLLFEGPVLFSSKTDQVLVCHKDSQAVSFGLHVSTCQHNNQYQLYSSHWPATFDQL